MTVGNCLMCGDKLKYYDSVRRIVRTKSRKSRWIIVPRYQCVGCRCIRRYLPDYIYPYKQYESEIIDGVIEGLITCDTVGFEDMMFRCKGYEYQKVETIRKEISDMRIQLQRIRFKNMRMGR